MQRKNIGVMECPVAKSLERVGEWWSILILRDAFYGLTKFDEFQKSLGIAPNMLSRRLNALVTEGLLDKVMYSEHPPRFEYHLTEIGLDFKPVLLTLLEWGNKHFVNEGKSVILKNTKTGKEAVPVLVDSVTGQIISTESYGVDAGLAASKEIKDRIKKTKALRSKGLAFI